MAIGHLVGKRRKALAERAAEEKPKVPKGKAPCHPTRNVYRDGFCRECWGASKVTAVLESQQRKLDHEIALAHRTVEYLEGLGRQARQILEDNLPIYASLHLAGAQVAAAQGDTRPSEWALQHVKAGKTAPVQPPVKQATDTGVRVFIGIADGAAPAITIDGHSLEPGATSND